MSQSNALGSSQHRVRREKAQHLIHWPASNAKGEVRRQQGLHLAAQQVLGHCSGVLVRELVAQCLADGGEEVVLNEPPLGISAVPKWDQG